MKIIYLTPSFYKCTFNIQAYPESQSKSEGKQFLESGAQESKAQSPLWPAPPGGTQHRDSALAWDQERVGVLGNSFKRPRATKKDRE